MDRARPRGLLVLFDPRFWLILLLLLGWSFFPVWVVAYSVGWLFGSILAYRVAFLLGLLGTVLVYRRGAAHDFRQRLLALVAAKLGYPMDGSNGHKESD